MKFYHATSQEICVGESLRTPTGHSEMNVLTGGVVYLTSKVESCQRYGKNVYEVECTNPVSYKAQLKIQGRSKKARYTRNVWIALPENTKILRKVGKEKI